MDGRLLYVQPVYTLRSGVEASYPILKFIIVSFGGEKVGIDTNLPAALGQLLGETPAPEDPGTEEPDGNQGGGNTSAEVRRYLSDAQAAFEAADKALAAGDLEEWGRQMELGQKAIADAIRASNKKSTENPSENPTDESDRRSPTGSPTGSATESPTANP